MRTDWQSGKGKLSIMASLSDGSISLIAFRINWTSQINYFDRRLK
ncbi:hypothetical protein STRINF_00758 [Streptococcus infantarius subsp. infantarius ATCC BAA-102]|uniref:Uncharacterized protein n=1 Tax=Streptococcus infantarius subsp. infantarius ATCC BAA-102 TaxID=471872 RepID=A0ABM9XF88_9STRE|nr:hypothetical protein STRINF_00758 [Streptococcus infantarius subsp. infantarius ATCC BAA-102]